MTDEIIPTPHVEIVTPIIDPNLAMVRMVQGFLGVKESGGDNRGEWVDKFEKSIGGKAEGQSWCLAFVQFCANEVAKQLGCTNKLFATEHCLTVWNKTDPKQRLPLPQVGCLIIWQFGNTAEGHVGTVVEVLPNNQVKTIEGNTSDGKGINRNGDGVYERVRSTKGSESFHVKGFLKVF